MQRQMYTGAEAAAYTSAASLTPRRVTDCSGDATEWLKAVVKPI